MKPHPVLLLAAALCAGPLAALAQQPPADGAPPAAAPPAGSNDPFIKGNDPLASEGFVFVGPRDCLVRLEYFALPPDTARRVMRQFPKQSDLYAWLSDALTKTDTGVKLERMDVLRVRGGQRSKLEGINEFPYPTEWDPPQIPQTIGIGLPIENVSTVPASNTLPVPMPPKPVPPTPAPTPPPANPPPKTPGAPGESGAPGAPGTPAALPPVGPPGSVPASRAVPPWPYNSATPTAFTTRNTGWTVEIELTVGEDGKTVDVNLAPQFSKPSGEESVTLNGEQTQPRFETRQISAQILTELGRPTFCGTFNRPPDTGAGGAPREEVMRLLFMTVIRANGRPAGGAADPFAEPPAPEVAAPAHGVHEGLVQFEAISLPLPTARQALLTHREENKLYAWLDGELAKKDSGVMVESTTTLRVRSGQRSRSEANREFPYPTEINPPQLPQTISLPPGGTGTPIPGTDSMFTPWPFSSTVVSSIQYRNLGWNFQVELTVGEDGRTVDLNIAPVLSRLVARLPYGAYRDIWQPVFETQQCTTQVLTTVGRPALVSTFTPPTGTDIPGANTSDRVWLLFVTVTFPQ